MFTRASSHTLLRALVLRALGVVTLIAFVSLWVQIDGLVGSSGILPFRDHLDAVAASGADPLSTTPTLFWWWPTDAALHTFCGLGCVLSVVLIAGVPVEGPVLLALWALYLSLCHVGQVFLGYQWDTLLLETLFVSMLIARWHPWSPAQPTQLGVWAVRLLLFKLMLGSGLVKLTSGDQTWWDGSALAYHYFTQPIPNPLSWFLHHLPEGWHSLETWATLAIEIVLPFAMFAERPGRLVAFVGFTVVLGMLFLTGNYGFFQLLSMVLVLALLDDRDLRWLEQRLVARLGRPLPTLALDAGLAKVRPYLVAREILVGVVLLGWFALSVPMQYGRTWSYDRLGPQTLDTLRTTAPFRTINAYGLFASMTTQRPELTIEGSDDGQTWEPYVFRYKPGPLERRPPVVAPHMPRLDWQLWFAALRNCRRSYWVQNLMVRLAENEPAVVALVEHDPFPDGGPRYIRAQRTLYAFSDSGPDWWQTLGPPDPYCRVIEMR